MVVHAGPAILEPGQLTVNSGGGGGGGGGEGGGVSAIET